MLKHVIAATHNWDIKVGFTGEDLRENSGLEVYYEGCIVCVHVGDWNDNQASFQKQES